MIWGNEEQLQEALRENYNRHVRVWAKCTRWGKSRYVKKVNKERRQSYERHLNGIGPFGNIALKEEYVFRPNRKKMASGGKVRK